MRVKVRNYKYVGDSYTGEIQKKDTPRSLNISFSEDIYIKHPEEFHRKLNEILYRYKYTAQTDQLCYKLENLISGLLRKWKDCDYILDVETIKQFPHIEYATLIKDDFFKYY